MGSRKKLKYLLVGKLTISHKEAAQLIKNGHVKVNGEIADDNIVLSDYAEVIVDNTVIQTCGHFNYYAWYKPVHIECTLNTHIAANLLTAMPAQLHGLFHIGRLDKLSEGLLLFTNDGPFCEKLLRPESKIEKEYVVEVNKTIDNRFIQNMSSGVEIMGRKTASCIIRATGTNTFRIILQQGMNRQIRRMCYKFDYEVIRLQRVRIGNIHIDMLNENGLLSFHRNDFLQL